MDGEDDEEVPNKRPARGPVPVVTDGENGVEPAQLTAPPQGLVPTPEYLRPAVLNPSISTAKVRLAVPKIRSHILRPLERGVLQADTTLEDASKIPENIILEARNPVSIREPAHITATKRGVVLWQDFLPRAIILVTGSRYFWAVAYEDSTIYVWTPAGRRLINALVLDMQAVILECREHWLLCVTAAGMVHVWNIKTMSSPHPPVNLGPVLEIATTSLSPHGPTPGPGVTSAALNSEGKVVVTISNGDGYFYSSDMQAWQRLSEAWWAVGSQYWNSNDSSVSALQSTAVGPVTASKSAEVDSEAINISAGIIPHLERHTTTEFLLKGRAYTLQRLVKALLSKDGFEDFESSVSIAHLENRIAGALQLGARDEFRLYLLMYAKRIGAEGLKGKVEELLNSLLGGLGGLLQEKKGAGGRRDEGRGWYSKDDLLCGWDRKELLKGVVMILGESLRLPLR
jgi:protein HIRA/HIR1